MTIKPLYEISEEVMLMENYLMACLDPETGEYTGIEDGDIDNLFQLKEQANTKIEDGDIDNLFQLKEQANTKAVAISHIILNLKAESEKTDTEIKRLTTRKRSCDNAVQRLKDYVLYCMQAMGVKSIGEKPYSLNRQRNAQPQVIVPDGETFETWEDKFKRVRIEPDKTAIAAAWKAGESFPASVEISEGEHVRIR